MYIVRYFEDFGRMGHLNRLFVVDAETLTWMRRWGTLYQYDVLGKHSEIKSTFNDRTLTILTDDAAFIAKAVELKLVDSAFPARVMEHMVDRIYDECSYFDRLINAGATPEELAKFVADRDLHDAWTRYKA
jgi:hypothetical protein